MDEKLKELFAKASFTYSKEEFQVISIPGAADVQIGGEGFSAAVKEKGGTTLVLPTSKWHELEPKVKNVKVQGPLRVLSLELEGLREHPEFMAEVYGMLSAQGISANAVSSYSKDHLLIRSKDFLRAKRLLEKAIVESGSTKAAEGAGV